MLATQNIHQNDEIDQSLIICFWWISQKVALITIKLDLITESMARFSGGEGVRGVKPPPKFFLTPSRKCLTPLEFCFTPLAIFGLPFHAPSKDQEWHIAYDLHPT